MSKVKNTIKIVLFCAIGIVIFGLVQKILTPNHSQNSYPNLTIKGFNMLENNSLDAVFLGPSTMHGSVFPMDIYKQTGIKAYNFSISGQPIDLSYEILKNVFRQQKPEIIVLDARGLTYEDNHSQNPALRYYAENIPLSKEKIEFAVNYTKYGYTDGTMSILFPIIKYHDRWSQLTKDDFIRVGKVADDYYFTMGTFFGEFINGTSLTAEQSDDIINEMIRRNPSEIKFREDTEEYQIKEVDSPIRTIDIPEKNKKILEQIKKLCDENECKLVLSSIPSRIHPVSNPRRAWGKDIQTEVAQLAAELGIEYVDFTYNIDIGIDMMTDTNDNGVHLNTLGARKITNYFCKYFTEQGIVGTGSDPVWDEQLVKWDKIMEIVDWQTDLDFHSYLNKLIANKDKLDIFISASTTYSDSLTAEEIEMFKQLGLTLVEGGGWCDSYAAIVSGGDVKYEAVSPRKITYNTTLDDGTKVNLVSSGWYTGSLSSIKIDGAEYSPNGECLNFVVREKETGMVIDCVRFATRYPEKTAYHTQQHANVTAYEQEVFNIKLQ